MGDEEDTRNVTGQTGDSYIEKIQHSLRIVAQLFRVELLPRIRWILPRSVFSDRDMQNLAVPEEDLMAIPRLEENIQRTFIAFISDETADKLRAMFRKASCPDIAPLTREPELPPKCQLLICCLTKNIRQMYLNDETVFTKLIRDAGSLQAMVLIIIFGEKETPVETLHGEMIYGEVLRKGLELYEKGRMHSQESLQREQTGGEASKSVALVTVDDRPSTYQLYFMKKFVEDAFTENETIPKST